MNTEVGTIRKAIMYQEATEFVNGYLDRPVDMSVQWKYDRLYNHNAQISPLISPNDDLSPITFVRETRRRWEDIKN